VQLGIGGKASYLVPQMSVDMVKNEKEDLKELIHYLTDTPDLSMEKMTSMGLTSGKAIEMAFFGALLKAMGSHGYYEEMIDRENSILKAFIGKVIDTGKEQAAKKLEVSLEFGNPLPDNLEDIINMLSTSTAGKATMSQETAVALNPLVTDAKEEMTRISNEEVSANPNRLD
jgi:SPP1 family phage portal protein